MPQQLLLFPDQIEDNPEKKIQDLQERHDRLRKSLHAKNNELKKKIDYLEGRLSLLESFICKGGLLL